MIMYFLPVTILFLVFASLQVTYTLVNRKEKREKKLLVNELLVALLFFSSGILYPFLYQAHNPSLDINVLNFLWITSSIMILAEMILWASIISLNAIKCRYDPERKLARDFSVFKKHFLEDWKYDFRKDVERKLLHMLPVAVIFGIWTIGSLFDVIGLLGQWNIDVFSFSYWLIVTIGFAFVLMFAVADLLRLAAPSGLPNWAIKWYQKSMKPNELETYISSAPLVLSFVPFLFAPFPVFASVALITSLGDAAASLIGKRYGKHKVSEKSKKTVEGYIAGISSTFLIVILTTNVYHSLYPINIGTIVAMATMAAFLFWTIDVFAKNVSDNLLNPLICGGGMWLVVLFA